MTNTTNYIITKHAYERMAERLKYNKKTAERMVEKIYKQGKPADMTKSITRKYLEDKRSNYETSEYRIYGEYLFVFEERNDDIVLITAFILPCSVRKNARYSMDTA